VLRATYPRAVSSLGREGVLIGRDALTGNAFAVDPFLAYAATGAEHLANPNTAIMGGLGQGKTSLVSSYLARQSLFDRMTRVFSVKAGEYDAYAVLVGASLVRVTPGGRTVLNPLDATFTGDPAEDAQIRPLRIGILGGLVEVLLRRERRDDESNALALALDAVVATNDQPTVPQVLAAFRDPSDDMLAELRLTSEQWAHRLHDTAQALYNLCHGEYAGLFNGHTDPAMRLDADHVVFDLEPLTRAGRFALAMFMVVAGGNLHNTLAKETRRNICVDYEEGWTVLAEHGIVKVLQQLWKKARSYGVQNIIVLHRPGDFAAAGHEGSREARLATGLLADTATKIVYRPEAHEREATGRMLALNPDETDALADLQVGEALWRIGDRSTIVQHILSDAERVAFNSDAGMVRQGAAHAV
jgi:type IV secretory pathway VirB4 component